LRRIDGKRIIVDFEKGRSILMWRPRRLGGG
jgi:U1 small nuclear ribonucleoprotein